MDSFFASAAVPLTIGFAYLLIAGYFELKTYRVPNALTLSAIVLALVFSIVAGIFAPERQGNIVSALVGMICIHAFLGFVRRSTMMPFVIYRIVVGALILGLLVI